MAIRLYVLCVYSQWQLLKILYNISITSPTAMYLPLFSVALLIFSSAVHVGEGLQQPAPPGCLHVNTTAHRIVDDWGRERYFHGVNVVVKGLPWLPRTDAFDSRWSFAEKDMQTLQELGLNAIRYLHPQI